MPAVESGLDRPVQYLKGVGPRRAKLLGKLGIRTVADLLEQIPERYYDRREMTPLAEIRPGERVTLEGVVTAIRGKLTSRKRIHVLEVPITDGEGRAVLIWFRQPYLEREFRIGDRVIATGRVQDASARIFVEEFEILGEGKDPMHAAGLVPSYPATRGISKRLLRSLVRRALDEAAASVVEVIPEAILRKRDLPGIRETLRRIHSPKTPEEAASGKRRVAYEEFFRLQVLFARRRHERQRERAGIRLAVSRKLNFAIRRRFPFTLTGAQERAIDDLQRDLAAPAPMNRLLQGDVGSGKTIVAAYAILVALGNGAQAALMAPTEILAEQHARTFGRLLEKSRVRIAYLGGGRRTKARKELLERIAAGEADLVIGTHAILERDVEFSKLALVVVDEQQKFGVVQRGVLGRKGHHPHRLVMTATPIPRTLCLLAYGDLDLTRLDEMPPGRRPVRTMYVTESGRAGKMAFVREKLREGRQAYFVYPLVEESARLEMRSATRMAEDVQRMFPDFPVMLLHGRMKASEKDAIMERFRSAGPSILVATTVVEVGIDVPNATVMVIEHAERYGLSQLHQLRGRIGRGPVESHCLVFGKRTERIDVFVSTTDGFRIAEEDLRIRGGGDAPGTRQSGPEFRAADPAVDRELLERAREDAGALVRRDPELGRAPALRAALRRFTIVD